MLVQHEVDENMILVWAKCVLIGTDLFEEENKEAIGPPHCPNKSTYALAKRGC